MVWKLLGPVFAFCRCYGSVGSSSHHLHFCTGATNCEVSWIRVGPFFPIGKGYTAVLGYQGPVGIDGRTDLSISATEILEVADTVWL